MIVVGAVISGIEVLAKYFVSVKQAGGSRR
jgi:hypothetical protein